MTATQRTSLRERQQDLARRLIFQALVDLVLEEGVHAFTVQRVAERAGLSHRTVYRYFPTRQAMLDALGEWGVEETQRAGLEMPSSLDELPEHARRIFASWDEREAVVRALVIVRLASGLEDSSRERRTAALLEAVREFAPHRSKADQLRVAHAIRALLNTTTWHQMRSDFGISGAEAGEAVAHTIRLLIDDLRGAPAKSAGAASG